MEHLREKPADCSGNMNALFAGEKPADYFEMALPQPFRLEGITAGETQ